MPSSRPTVAIIGASADRSKYGNKAVRAFRDEGWDVFPINPGLNEVEGIPAYASLLSILFAAGALFLRNTFLSIFCSGCCALLQSMYLGPSIAVAHSLVPASMRALTSAILFLVLNLVGLGFGPLVIGIISDRLAPALGTESLRWAMSITLLVSLASTLLFFRTAQKLVVDLKLKA